MIGRKQELEILEECLGSGRPEFLALYGRRRVGKTYLIKEFFNETFSFYATGVNGENKKYQLRAFKSALEKYGDPDRTIPKDWFEAFERLQKLLQRDEVVRDYKSGRRVIFLDELPWMDTPRSEFKSAFDFFWNSWGSSQKDLFLIVCGSATSWIMDNIVKDTGGLYNRITRQMRLMPFDLSECEQLLKLNGLRYSRKQVVESYMIFGGIPYYLNYLRPQYSLAQNVDMLFFQESGPLRYEFGQLFSALYKKSDKYIAIVRELSKKTGGLTRAELLEGGKTVEGKELTECLESLEQCGFIRKYRDFTKEKSGYHYQLIDSFVLFYLRFIEKGKVDTWTEYILTPAYYAWGGLAFERVCLMNMKQIKKALGISGISSRESAWKSKKKEGGAQIDLLIDRKDDVINVCEMKYTQEEFAIDAGYEKELIHKLEVFREETGTKKALWLTMITYAGVKNNEYKDVVMSELSIDDLF